MNRLFRIRTLPELRRFGDKLGELALSIMFASTVAAMFLLRRTRRGER